MPINSSSSSSHERDQLCDQRWSMLWSMLMEYGPIQCYDVWNVVEHGFPVYVERGPIRVWAGRAWGSHTQARWLARRRAAEPRAAVGTSSMRADAPRARPYEHSVSRMSRKCTTCGSMTCMLPCGGRMCELCHLTVHEGTVWGTLGAHGNCTSPDPNTFKL